jgi:hypothetical protein
LIRLIGFFPDVHGVCSLSSFRLPNFIRTGLILSHNKASAFIAAFQGIDTGCYDSNEVLPVYKKGAMSDLFTLGAFAVIRDDQGRVLLCHRRDMDAWNLPGGGVCNGELPTEAVVRETREETGLEIVVEQLTGIYGKPNSTTSCLCFCAGWSVVN